MVLIKRVPDTWSERKLTDGDFTLTARPTRCWTRSTSAPWRKRYRFGREAADGIEGSVTVLTAGPERATEAIRKAVDGATRPST